MDDYDLTISSVFLRVILNALHLSQYIKSITSIDEKEITITSQFISNK